MNRHEEDGVEDLGWLIAVLAALGALFIALAHLLHWAGWL